MFNLSFSSHDGASTSAVIEPDTHEWRAPQDGDVRSPCPALNTLANHGYLPHDGKQLDAATLIHALKEGYGLSGALADVLAYGGVALLGQRGKFSLNDLARHNRIEHNASLVHDDAKGRDEYAPIAADKKLIEEFLDHIKDGKVVTVEDVARARVWRESQCAGLNRVQQEIARGEMAIAIGLFSQPDSNEEGIPIDLMRIWFSEERLPKGWKPTHTQGLLQTIHTSQQISNEMTKIKEDGEITIRT